LAVLPGHYFVILAGISYAIVDSATFRLRPLWNCNVIQHQLPVA